MKYKKILIDGTIIAILGAPMAGSFFAPVSQEYCQSLIGRYCDSRLPGALQKARDPIKTSPYMEVSTATASPTLDLSWEYIRK